MLRLLLLLMVCQVDCKNIRRRLPMGRYYPVSNHPVSNQEFFPIFSSRKNRCWDCKEYFFSGRIKAMEKFTLVIMENFFMSNVELRKPWKRESTSARFVKNRSRSNRRRVWIVTSLLQTKILMRQNLTKHSPVYMRRISIKGVSKRKQTVRLVLERSSQQKRHQSV